MTPSKYHITFKRKGIVVRHKTTSTHIDKSVQPEKVTHNVVDVEDCYSSINEFAKEIAEKLKLELESKILAKQSGFLFNHNSNQMTIECGVGIVKNQIHRTITNKINMENWHKFKAWDSANKSMSNPFTLLEWLSLLSKATYYAGRGDALSHADNDHERWCNEKRIFLQFTGILDREGKEIYEGDIIQWEAKDNLMPDPLMIVKFGKYCTDETKEDEAESWHCGFYLSPIEEMQENWGLTDGRFEDKFKVVGNIYENQDIVEKYKNTLYNKQD